MDEDVMSLPFPEDFYITFLNVVVVVDALKFEIA